MARKISPIEVRIKAICILMGICFLLIGFYDSFNLKQAYTKVSVNCNKILNSCSAQKTNVFTKEILEENFEISNIKKVYIKKTEDIIETCPYSENYGKVVEERSLLPLDWIIKIEMKNGEIKDDVFFSFFSMLGEEKKEKILKDFNNYLTSDIYNYYTYERNDMKEYVMFILIIILVTNILFSIAIIMLITGKASFNKHRK